MRRSISRLAEIIKEQLRSSKNLPVVLFVFPFWSWKNKGTHELIIFFSKSPEKFHKAAPLKTVTRKMFCGRFSTSFAAWFSLTEL